MAFLIAKIALVLLVAIEVTWWVARWWTRHESDDITVKYAAALERIHDLEEAAGVQEALLEALQGLDRASDGVDLAPVLERLDVLTKRLDELPERPISVPEPVLEPVPEQRQPEAEQEHLPVATVDAELEPLDESVEHTMSLLMAHNARLGSNDVVAPVLGELQGAEPLVEG